MKKYLLTILYIAFLSSGNAQANRVFSGGEALNFGIVDLSFNKVVSWSSERSNNPGYFSLLENAKYIGYSDHSNVDGYVKKYGTTPFVFPVGTGKDLRTLEISKPNTITDAYATAWIEGDPSNNLDPTKPHAGKHSVLAVSKTISAVSKIGQWDWQVGDGGNLGNGTTGNGAGLTITVSMPDISDFAKDYELRLVGWNGTNWIDLSGLPTATGNTENCKISGTMIPGISAIAIGKTSSFPFVKLKSIFVTSSNCTTMLKWETSFENNKNTFIIEQSLDGYNFHPIASMQTNSSSTGKSYSKQVVQQFGIAHYRLKFIHSSGAYSYSQAVLFDYKCNEIINMQIYPNPVADNENISIRFTNLYEGVAEIMISNSAGQLVFRKSIQVKKGLNFITPEIKNLIHGTYSIKIIAKNGEQIGIVKKFIKQ